MRFHCLLPLAALCAFCLPASAAGVDYAKSEITFVSKQMNVPVQGRFRKFTAQITFEVLDKAQNWLRDQNPLHLSRSQLGYRSVQGCCQGSGCHRLLLFLQVAA